MVTKVQRSFDPSERVYLIAKEFSNKGIGVVFLADNKIKRYDTKRATVQRQSAREKEKLQLLEKKWFLYAEYIHRQSLSRWSDYASPNIYDLCVKTCRLMFDTKCDLVLKARRFLAHVHIT